jgi:hypothetical protein
MHLSSRAAAQAACSIEDAESISAAVKLRSVP